MEAAFKRDTVGLQTREQFQTIKANIEKQVQQEKDDAQIAKEECVPPSLATPLGSVGFRRLLLSSPSHATHARGMCCRNELRVRAQKRDSTKKKKTAEQAVVRRCAVSLRAPHPSDLTLPWKFRLRCGRAQWMVQGWSYTTGLLYDGAVWNDASAPPGQWRRAAWVGQLRLTEWSHPTGGVPDWVCGHACQPRRFPSRGEDMRGGLCDPPAVLSPQG